jgi:hypothetical protein
VLRALVLALAVGGSAGELRIVSLDAAPGALDVAGRQVIELRATDDDGIIERTPALKGWTRVQRGLGPGPDRSLITSLVPLERSIEPFACRPYGALFARLRTDDGPLDVYAIQFAGKGSTCQEERVSQAFELSEIIARRSGKRPYVIFGRRPKPDDEAYKTLADLLNLVHAGGERVFAPRGASRWLSVSGSPVEARVDPRYLKAAPSPDPARRAAALLSVRSSIDEQLRGSARRERWTWVPVYGLAVSLRLQRWRERLGELRARAETARIVAVETQ